VTAVGSGFDLHERERAPKETIQVAGIEVSATGVADLALRLHRAGQETLGVHVGLAWDRCYEDVQLDERDCVDILAVLDGDAPEHLADLRAALLARVQESAEAGRSASAA
jgi:hypothetical protein